MAMSDRELQEAALSEARKLNTSISNLSKDTKELTAYGHRNRLLIRVLALSILFNLFVCIVLGVGVFVAKSASNKATSASDKAAENATQLHVDKVAQYESCLSSNKARATQVTLWNNVFNTIGEARLPEIPELRRQVDESFVQRECVIP